jgi:DNA repair exonuclease SbcCD nuclease subunit
MRVDGLNKLDIISLSDIHLGHPDNPAERIIKNLKNAFSDNASMAEIDIIFIAGDVFDRLLSLPDDAVTEIDFWITSFLRLCKKHDIVLRVLEGTPSHDWKQSKRFVKINELSRIGADVQHVTELSIEYIDRFGINVLYVPDELPGGTNKTFESVLELMEERGLKKVELLNNGPVTIFMDTHNKE